MSQKVLSLRLRVFQCKFFHIYDLKSKWKDFSKRKLWFQKETNQKSAKYVIVFFIRNKFLETGV